ncbi:Cupin region protein [Candidatus Filomicrobium marinum]|uniref:Cupin region protein n=1 Tax=Candidatus Filomicrobium marinum TaxID=1608628 RepID=A0A0D6JJG5_9HYPH|nr:MULTISPECIES: cupin domain-containing protein [Filomicrobium]MCV0370973.1 cupin domain-containing protein [Filomicrobium sp.]CFX34665.1 Cupin region protein [Candidatus Filomicrobium marinum]CPR21847.1 Cupin region protein [Candidatus Filomicrobium marinum]
MVSAADRAKIIRPGQTYVGQQGFTYQAGVSRGTVGETSVCMNVLPMPPGAKAKAHYHKDIDTIAYLLEGRCSVYYGDQFEHRVEMVQGEQMFMPRDVPHAPVNDSGAPCTWIVVHSSGDDQDDIIMTPHLDALLPKF